MDNEMIEERWQPIETAPKDGTRIDLWIVDQDGDGYREPDAYWVEDALAHPYAVGDPEKWGKTRAGWYGPNHDYDGGDGWADTPEWVNKVTGKVYFQRATHWMPPPEPPSG